MERLTGCLLRLSSMAPDDTDDLHAVRRDPFGFPPEIMSGDHGQDQQKEMDGERAVHQEFDRTGSEHLRLEGDPSEF